MTALTLNSMIKHLQPTWLTNTTELAPTAAPKAPNMGRGLTGCGVGMEALGFPVENRQEIYFNLFKGRLIFGSKPKHVKVFNRWYNVHVKVFFN